MSTAEPVRPVLLFACGNPSRGDDALGPLLLERMLHRRKMGELQHVELLTDFQLQVEHALDLRGRERVIFTDASATGPEPFSFTPVVAEADASYCTHVMSPGGVLRVFEQVTGTDAPPAWLLGVRGYRFDLGSPCTERAERNLRAATDYLSRALGSVTY